MSARNICACANSTNNDRKTKGAEQNNEDEFVCPKSRGPHPVHRKKYKPDELNTTGFQCNCKVNQDNDGTTATRNLDVQCDLDSDDEDVHSICSNCRCTSGFCNERCEAAKQKMGRNRSDSWKTPASAIPVPVKRNSSPGLSSLVAETKAACKCVGKCMRECEKRKLTEAVAAIRSANSGKNSAEKACAENQCRSACSRNIQTDLDEPPIAPLAPILEDKARTATQPQMTPSNVCMACQCNGPCSIECTIHKHGINDLFTAEDLYVSQIDTCVVCDCTGECSEVCKADKLKKAQKNSICEICKCRGTCTPECTQRKQGMAKEIQAGAPVSTCHCETMVKGEWDEFKETQTVPGQAAPVTSQGVVCTLCECVGGCNDVCLAANNKQNAPNLQNPLDGTSAVCDVARMICEECVCNATCTPRCEAAKNRKDADKPGSMAQVCEVCKCIGKCTATCEKNKVAQGTAKELKFNDADKPSTPWTPNLKTVENATQVRGIIEEFNNDDLMTHVGHDQMMAKDKAKSTCDVAKEMVCEICKCTGVCSPKCAAIRQIRSVAEFPPANTVCDNCMCLDKCTKPCEMKKSNNTCVTAAGQPIECNEMNMDWIPCITCKPDAPCSPECRERMALATVMPKPHAGLQFNEPEAVGTSVTPVQTHATPISCSNAQTVQNDAVMRSTSTPNGIIQRGEFGGAEEQSCGVPSNMVAPPASDQCDLLCNAPCKDDSITLLGGPHEHAPGDQSQAGEHQECGMCLKLRSYLCSMFQNETSTCPQGQPNDPHGDKDKGKKNKEGFNKKQVSEIVCNCLDTFAQQGKKINQSQKPPSDEDRRPCKCSRSLGLNKGGSHTDRMQSMMGHLKASCEDAELVASPFIKAASAFTLDVNNQQEAIVALLQKCRQKDHYIDALIDDVLDRSKSKVFESLLSRLKEQNLNAPDFDGSIITSALDKTKVGGPVGGIELAGFKINSVKRVGATSLLVKWNPPSDGRICGYDINVNGQLKTSIASKDRLYAILDALDFGGTISIEIYAMAPKGRAYPAIVAYYAKY